MGEHGLFPDSYKDFLKRRNDAKGYDFQHAPSGSALPPTVSFREKLRWWTWDRWKRKKVIRHERDQRVQDIFRIRKGKGLDPKER